MMLTGTVLIIEVDPDITKNLGSILRAKGIATVVVREATPLGDDFFPEVRPELILFQMLAKDTKAAALLRAVKKNPRLSRVPILAVSSRTLH